MIKEFISTIRNLPRHIKTAFQGVIRNGAMSISSMFAVTITLLLVSTVLMVAFNIQSITKSIESQLIIHVQLNKGLPQENIDAIETVIKADSRVKSVTFRTPDEELDIFIASMEGVDYIIEEFRDDVPMGAAFVVEVKDSSEIQSVANMIQNEYGVKRANAGSGTMALVKTFETIRNGGFIFAIALSILAIFMISNTIKLTITARKTEISIMRLVGASNAYIRTPFMLEGIIIGIGGSIIPVILTILGYQKLYLESQGFLGAQIMQLMPVLPFVYEISLYLIVIGISVGLIGSFFSVSRFLKN